MTEKFYFNREKSLIGKNIFAFYKRNSLKHNTFSLYNNRK